jgi:VWFA-related protein
VKKAKKCAAAVIIGVVGVIAGPASPSDHALHGAVQLQKPIQHEVSVTLKLVQVYVTDKNGNPVRDLGKEDFVVRDGGRVMALTAFEKHILEIPARKPDPHPDEDRGRLLPEPGPPAAPIAAMTRKFFLFFDFAYNNQKGIDKAKEAAFHLIDAQLIPGDEVGLLSYSMLKGLSIHEYLTTNHKKVREAVGILSPKGIAGRAEDTEEEYWRRAGTGGGGVYAKSPSQLEAERNESKLQAQNFILKMNALAKALRYVPGQKHFILFSTGIPSTLLTGNRMSFQTRAERGASSTQFQIDAGDKVLIGQNEAMLKELAAANCTVFTFDTREAALVSSLFTYDQQTFEERNRPLFSASAAAVPVNVFKDDQITGGHTIGRMSAATGGKYFSNIHEYEKNLGQIQNLTGSYYVLGFSIDEQRDGRYHDLKVEVKRKGVEVRAQAGYFNPKPFRDSTDLEKRLHLFDLALNERPLLQNPLPFSVTGLSYPRGRDMRLELLSKIPPEVIDKFAGKKVELVTLVFDAKEDLAGLRRMETDLTRFHGMEIYFVSGVSARPGSYKCRLVVRDLETGVAAVASAMVHIPPRAAAGVDLYSPLLLVPEGNVVYLDEIGGKPKDALSWKAVYPYEEALYSPVVASLPGGATKFFAVIPFSTAGLSQPDLKFAAYFVDSTSGRRLPVSSSILNAAKTGDIEVRFLEFPLKDVPPGKYYFYLHAEDTVTKSGSHVQTPLVVQKEDW